jgi:transcriptional regulator with XRE-family HTH domain
MAMRAGTGGTVGFGCELKRWRSVRRVSQLDLANLAGTTQRHVSFIEQGRSRPGRPIVIRLAESLGLTLRERNALLHAAGFAPVFAETPLDGPILGPVREALDSIIEGHLPYPAMVVGPYGDVVAANSSVDVLTEGSDPALLEPPVNMLRLMLHPQGMARRVGNPGQWGRHVIEALRARSRRAPDTRLDALIAELAGYLPEPEPESEQLGFAVPLRLTLDEPWQSVRELRLITTLTSFSTAVDVTLSELRLEAFLPADAGTARYLQHISGASPAAPRPAARRESSTAG